MLRRSISIRTCWKEICYYGVAYFGTSTYSEDNARTAGLQRLGRVGRGQRAPPAVPDAPQRGVAAGAGRRAAHAGRAHAPALRQPRLYQQEAQLQALPQNTTGICNQYYILSTNYD